MDSKVSMPSRGQQSEKKAYSSPTLVDIGAIEQIALGGTGTVAENAQMINLMKHM